MLSRSVDLVLQGTITADEANQTLPKYRQRIAELTRDLSFFKEPFKVAKLRAGIVDHYLANLDRLAISLTDHLAVARPTPFALSLTPLL
jgi:hypothetical protein